MSDHEAQALLDAERHVLGAMLTDPEAALTAPRLLRPDDFSRSAHGYIFRAISALSARGLRPDSVLTAQELTAHDTLEQAGGLGAVVQLLEFGIGSGVNLPAWCSIVASAARRRRAVRIATQIAADPASANGKLDELRAALQPEADASWAARAHTARSLQSATYPPLVSVFGDGLLARGDMGILYGETKLGKSWLVTMLALSIARGEPWLGIPGPPQPMRVGMVALEVHAERMKHRLQVIGGDMPDNLWLLCLPDIPPVINLLALETRAALMGFCRSFQLDLLILDPLSRTHQTDENDTRAGAEVMAAVHSLRSESGAAILLVHHERKAPASQKERSDDDLGALRGNTRFQTDPTLLMRVRRHGGLLQLRCPGANNRQPFEPIFIRPSKGDGPAIVVPDPAKTAEQNATKVLEALASLGGWRSPDEVAKACDLSRKTASAHLSRSDTVEWSGTTRNRRCRIREECNDETNAFPSDNNDMERNDLGF